MSAGSPLVGRLAADGIQLARLHATGARQWPNGLRREAGDRAGGNLGSLVRGITDKYWIPVVLRYLGL